MLFTASSDGRLRIGGREVACALGRGGVVAAGLKREGDGATPLGRWALRRVLYRADRIARPVTALPCAAIGRDDGWCDAPHDPRYNRPVRLPYPASAERMWRADGLYDLLCVLAHNDDPPIPGLGSAIFLHVAAPDFAPTQGCVALELADLKTLLAIAGACDRLEVVEGGGEVEAGASAGAVDGDAEIADPPVGE